MSKKRIKINEGDVFVLSDFTLLDKVISLNEQHRLAKIIFISRITKMMIGIVLSEDIFEEIPDNANDVVFSNEIYYTDYQLLRSGDWPIIGNQPVTEHEKNLTLRLVGSSIYLLDEYLGVAPRAEKKKYKKQLMHGIAALYYVINNR